MQGKYSQNCFAFFILQHDNKWDSQIVKCLDYHDGYESYESGLYIGWVVL